MNLVYPVLLLGIPMRAGGVREQILHCWFSGSQKNNTWLVETL